MTVKNLQILDKKIDARFFLRTSQVNANTFPSAISKVISLGECTSMPISILALKSGDIVTLARTRAVRQTSTATVASGRWLS